MSWLKNGSVMIVGMVLLMNFLVVQHVSAQAPDCDQCDDLIDDPIAYAECVEEFCSDAIPIDNEVWILIAGGIGIGVYTLYKFRSGNVTLQTES